MLSLIEISTFLRRIFFFVLILISAAFYSSCSPMVGPKLLSEGETEHLAQEKAGIIQIEKIELCYMPEPIYRLVLGRDEKGEEKAVWIDTDVRKAVNLKEGIPRSEATKIAKDHGFAEPIYIHLIYQPSEGGKVLWRITDVPPEAPRNHELWLDFYDGRIIWEWKG